MEKNRKEETNKAFHFVEGEVEAQRGAVTCLMWPGRVVAQHPCFMSSRLFASSPYLHFFAELGGEFYYITI